MKLEVGKFYKTRNGRKAECLLVDERIKDLLSQAFCFVFDELCAFRYALDGTYAPSPSEWDIVSEWRDPVKLDVYMYRVDNGVFASSLPCSNYELIAKYTMTEGEGM